MSGESENDTGTKKTSIMFFGDEEDEGDYLVISDTWLCFIPENDFAQYFEVIDENEANVKILKEKFQGQYGGWDTYLQSYCLDHARSNIHSGGGWNTRLLGVYNLIH